MGYENNKKIIFYQGEKMKNTKIQIVQLDYLRDNYNKVKDRSFVFQLTPLLFWKRYKGALFSSKTDYSKFKRLSKFNRVLAIENAFM